MSENLVTEVERLGEVVGWIMDFVQLEVGNSSVPFVNWEETLELVESCGRPKVLVAGAEGLSG